MKFNEKELEILVSYEQIKAILDNVAASFSAHKSSMIDYIAESVCAAVPGVMYEKSSNSLGVYSLKFYKGMWYKKSEYYFFVEVLFDEGKLENISFQKVIKDYPRKSTEKKIQEFLECEDLPLYLSNGQYHIWGVAKKYTSKRHWTEEDWELEFMSRAPDIVERLIRETDELVEGFWAFSQGDT